MSKCEIDKQLGSDVSVFQLLCWSVVVKLELSFHTEVSVYIPILRCHHELWVVIHRKNKILSRGDGILGSSANLFFWQCEQPNKPDTTQSQAAAPSNQELAVDYFLNI